MERKGEQQLDQQQQQPEPARAPGMVAEDLVRLALDRGAAEARLIRADSVVTAEWVRLKCQFGCDEYGKWLACPPHSPTPETTARVLSSYRRAILLHLPQQWRQLKKLVVGLEREAFLAGHHKAFAMGTGPCYLCKECGLGEGCKHRDRLRPSMEACGIDVYTTVRNNGMTLEPVRTEECVPNYYAMLLLD